VVNNLFTIFYKYIQIAIFIAIPLVADDSHNGLLGNKLTIITPIQPISIITKQITKDVANVYTLMGLKSNPHNYEPKPSQLINIKKADIYVEIGLQSEHKLLPKFQNLNKNLKIIHSDKSIDKLYLDNNDKAHIHSHNEGNPHIWLSPKRLKIIANNIYSEMIVLDSQHKSIYTKNYNNLIDKLNSIDSKFKSFEGAYFVASDDTLAYLAVDYGYHILPIGYEHKQANFKTILKITKHLKNQKKYKTIIANERENTKMAKILSQRANLKYTSFNPIGDIFKTFDTILEALE